MIKCNTFLMEKFWGILFLLGFLICDNINYSKIYKTETISHSELEIKYKNKGFYLKGKIKGMDNGIIYLKRVYGKREEIFDSCLVKNGNFELRGKVAYPIYLLIEVPDYAYINVFYLENSRLNIYLDLYTNKFNVKGGKENKVYYKYIELIDSFYNRNNRIYTGVSRIKKTDSLYLISLYEDSLEFVKAQLIKKVDSFILRNKSNYNNIEIIQAQFCDEINYKQGLKLYGKLDSKVRESESGLALLNYLKNIDNNINRKLITAPFFKLADTTGKEVALNAFKGKIVLIDFWASWCKPCIEELPALKKMKQIFSPNQFSIISISIDKDSKAWLKATKKYEIEWESLIKDSANKVIYDYEVEVIPKKILIDKSGKNNMFRLFNWNSL